MPVLSVPHDGSYVRYRDHASGSDSHAAGVVLVHGWGLTGDAWYPVVRRLTERNVRAVVVDLRGHGGSTHDAREMTIAAMASDVSAVVEACGMSSAVLVGWSLGGSVALAATALTSAAAGLVLVNAVVPRFATGPDWPHGVPEEVPGQMAAALTDDRPQFARALVEGLFQDAPDGEVVRWLWQQVMSTGPTADRAIFDLAALDQRPAAMGVTVPTLVCGAPHDPVAPFALSKAAAQLIPNARLLSFERSGHAIPLEEPDKFVDALVEHAALAGITAGLPC